MKGEVQSLLREDEMKWRQWSKCKWLKEGDKTLSSFMEWLRHEDVSIKFQHCNIGRLGLKVVKTFLSTIVDFFSSLYSGEYRFWPRLDNLTFTGLNEERAGWLEREFEVDEIKQAVFNLGSLGPGGFPLGL